MPLQTNEQAEAQRQFLAINHQKTKIIWTMQHLKEIFLRVQGEIQDHLNADDGAFEPGDLTLWNRLGQQMRDDIQAAAATL